MAKKAKKAKKSKKSSSKKKKVLVKSNKKKSASSGKKAKLAKKKTALRKEKSKSAKKAKKINKAGKKKKERILKNEFSGEPVKKVKIRVIGIGGGGGAIISEIASGLKKSSFVAANTDSQALRAVKKQVSCFQFGQDLTNGLGTGMNAEIGREAAQKEKERIKKILEGQDLCVLVACLGGGTSSGALPVFAKISRELGNLTYGIVTLPFKFEGDKKMELARDSLKSAKNYLQAISVLPNERVFQITDKATPLKQALSIINKNLSESLGGLIDTIYQPSLINIDFADLRTVLEGKGRLSYLNTVDVQRKEGATKDLIERALTSPLYPYGIKGAKGVLFNIEGQKNLSLSEVNQISKNISELVSKEAKIIFGISQGQKNSGSVKITILATGCALKIFPSPPSVFRRNKEKKEEEKPKEEEDISQKEPQEEKNISSFSSKKKKKKRARPKAVSKKPKKEVEEKPKKKRKPSAKKEIKINKSPLRPIQQTQKDREDFYPRKNGLQLKKEAEEEEKELEARERFWETPAFLRRKSADRE